MSENQSNLNLEPIEKQIMDKANFLYICQYNGKEHLRTCIREAVINVTGLNESQFCNMFSIYKGDLESYIDIVYKKMQELGAE